MPASQSFGFLSPLRKLVSFFKRSRDKWKEKCKTAKRQIKSLKLCLAKMKESRDRWKARAIALEAAVSHESINSPGGRKKERLNRRTGMPHETCLR